MKTIIITGLGNPGKKYEKTRHNAGFMFVDYFWENFRDDICFSEWEFKKSLNAEISIGKIENMQTSKEKNQILNFLAYAKKFRIICSTGKTKGMRIILLKPCTFMNLSGEALKRAVSFYKIKPENLLVVHDDIDLGIGKYKISFGSSSAGHNGVQNIIDQLGTKDFSRIRIGIDNRGSKPISTEKYVLNIFTSAERKIIYKVHSEILEEFFKN